MKGTDFRRSISPQKSQLPYFSVPHLSAKPYV